MKSNQEPCFKI